MSYLFTSESVGIGHPDKVADRISDTILDHCLRGDRFSRVGVEVMVKDNTVVLGGEITSGADLTNATLAGLVRDAVNVCGYRDPYWGFHGDSCHIINLIGRQSPDIAQGVDRGRLEDQGAGDQGIMFGYATDESPEGLPLSLVYSHRLVRSLKEDRERGILPYLGPDCKAQVTMEYNSTGEPQRVHTVVLSTQHREEISLEDLRKDALATIMTDLPIWGGEDPIFHINPTGKFVIGGPIGDCGLTGRKIVVDTYGGACPHGGGAFSGKDPSKVDRSAAYMARHMALMVVRSKLAKRCTIQLAYAIGVKEPVSIKVDTHGTHLFGLPDHMISEMLRKTFDLTPWGITEYLGLLDLSYSSYLFPGHFGGKAPWEDTPMDVKTEFLSHLL